MGRLTLTFENACSSTDGKLSRARQSILQASLPTEETKLREKERAKVEEKKDNLDVS